MKNKSEYFSATKNKEDVSKVRASHKVTKEAKGQRLTIKRILFAYFGCLCAVGVNTNQLFILPHQYDLLILHSFPLCFQW